MNWSVRVEYILYSYLWIIFAHFEDAICSDDIPVLIPVLVSRLFLFVFNCLIPWDTFYDIVQLHLNVAVVWNQDRVAHNYIPLML